MDKVVKVPMGLLRGKHESFITLGEKKLPAAVAYKIAKIIREMEESLIFYNQRFQELLDEYAEKEQDGTYKMSEDKTYIIIQEGKRDSFQREYDELNQVEIEIKSSPISLESLEKYEFTADEFSTLVPFIEE